MHFSLLGRCIGQINFPTSPHRLFSTLNQAHSLYPFLVIISLLLIIVHKNLSNESHFFLFKNNKTTSILFYVFDFHLHCKQFNITNVETCSYFMFDRKDIFSFIFNNQIHFNGLHYHNFQ